MPNIVGRVLHWLSAISAASPAAQQQYETESALRTAAEEKYRQLYVYATDLLKDELERFNRADEKAAKIATTFVFLIGAAAYFDKLIFDKLLPPRSLLEWSLVILGGLTLIVSFVGWFFANWVPRMRGYSRLPLNKDVFDFFDQQPLLNFYGSFSKNAEEAFRMNQKRTDQKHAVLIKAFYAMVLATALLVSLVSLYGLYSWQNPGKFDSLKKQSEHDPKGENDGSAHSEGPTLGEHIERRVSDLPKPDWAVKAPNLIVSLNSQPLIRAEPPDHPEE
jgi:hypothetical protein